MPFFRKIQRRLFPPFECLEGYEQSELIETVFRKTIAFEPVGDWPLVADACSVLDFGGGCGLHYKLARLQSPDIRWAVVETPAMVARARELETDHLRFFTDIEPAAEWLSEIDLMHSNSALQYTSEPLATLKRLCKLDAQIMYWARLWITEEPRHETQSSYLTDNGPRVLSDGPEKLVRYERVSTTEADFLAAHANYSLRERGPDWFWFVHSSTR